MALQQFDKLNDLGTKAEPIDYEEYFNDDLLTEQQRRVRIDFSKDMEQLMLFAFSLINILATEGSYDYAFVVESIVSQYKKIIEKYTDSQIDEFFANYSAEFGKEITRTTIDNLVDAYFLSRARATVIAANEADTILNRKDYIDSIVNGKSKKQWMDVRDFRERPSHRKVGRSVIGINELFRVGNTYMRFPHDVEFCNNPKELINCRCRIKYL